MKILRMLEKNTGFWLILASSFIFFLLRFPSLFEPLWYGDEGIYQAIGSSLNSGMTLYKEIFDNKPPLLYWLYSLFGSDQFAIRLVSLIFGILSIIIFFLVCKKLFKTQSKICYLSTVIFTILFGLPMFEGNIANAENFMLLPIITSSLLVISQKRFFIAGVILGLAFLFKIVAIFDLSAFLVFCFIINFNSQKRNINLSSIALGFSLPIVLVSLYFLVNGAFSDFIKAIFLTNIPYVNYGNKIGNLPILLFVKLVLLGIFVIYLLKKRKNINTSSLFILIWFAFSVFNALFSQRPYTHYLLVLLPSFSLMIGLIFFDKKNIKQIFIFLLIIIIILAKVFGIPKIEKNIRYYQNFISYIKNGKTTTSYQNFFDRNTPIDYEIARFIKPKLQKDDKIFVWGNNAQLYELTNTLPITKYVVAYHITSYKDGVSVLTSALEKMKPKYVVIMPNQKTIPYSLTNYFNKIKIGNANIYERVF